ncbi:hypothetical protein Hamer_G019725 [Homarus americanus]|uniref:Uncharacterized protein n=1 Tax=Homarus americanus TaxID=6706 RepID=A0A8J5N061_HOMAM|nr:hypothetical protein Hamer_G019725 [Homarus americanus]
MRLGGIKIELVHRFGHIDGVKFGCHWVSGLADAAMVVVVVDGDLPPHTGCWIPAVLAVNCTSVKIWNSVFLDITTPRNELPGIGWVESRDKDGHGLTDGRIDRYQYIDIVKRLIDMKAKICCAFGMV